MPGVFSEQPSLFKDGAPTGGFLAPVFPIFLVRSVSPRTPCAARAWPRGQARRLPWPGWVFGSTQAQGAQPSALGWGRPRTLDRPQWALPEADGLWVHVIHEHQLFISVTWRGCLVNIGSKPTPGTSCVGPSSFLQREDGFCLGRIKACSLKCPFWLGCETWKQCHLRDERALLMLRAIGTYHQLPGYRLQGGPLSKACCPGLETTGTPFKSQQRKDWRAQAGFRVASGWTAFQHGTGP